MFVYEKKLQYPVRIKNTNPKLASIIISQYGGPNGELGAALRYLSQRYSMPFDEQRGLLTDIGTEELGASGDGRHDRPPAHAEPDGGAAARRAPLRRISSITQLASIRRRPPARPGQPQRCRSWATHQRSVREPCGRAEGPLDV